MIKKLFCLLPAILISQVILIHGCKTMSKPVNLEPGDKRILYSLSVQDNDEAMILREKLKIEIFSIKEKILYFYSDRKDVFSTMDKLGYSVNTVDPSSIMEKVVRVLKKNRKPAFEKNGLLLITETEEAWIVRGSLKNLKAFRDMGFKIKYLEKEIYPKKITILVGKQTDVQTVASVHIDILGVKKEENGLIIFGQAFDYQINKLKEYGFDIIEEGGEL